MKGSSGPRPPAHAEVRAVVCGVAGRASKVRLAHHLDDGGVQVGRRVLLGGQASGREMDGHPFTGQNVVRGALAGGGVVGEAQEYA